MLALSQLPSRTVQIKVFGTIISNNVLKEILLQEHVYYVVLNGNNGREFIALYLYVSFQCIW